MRTNSISSILRTGVAAAALGVSACSGATTDTPNGSVSQGGSAGQGGSSGQAGSTTTGNAAGSGAGGSTTDAGAGVCPPGGNTDPGATLGLSSDAPMNVDGTVSRVDPDRLEIVTSTGMLTLSWAGPPLDAAFATGDVIQVVRTRVDPVAPGGWSVVRSARATAAVFNGIMWDQLGTTSGSTHTVAVPSDYPSLLYSLESCCSVVAGTRCSYGSLQATYDTMTSHIDVATTGRVGPWSITNVLSSYYINGTGESAWGGRATLLGPATVRAADGGI